MKIGIYGQFYHKNSEYYIQLLLDSLEKENIEVGIEDEFLKIIRDNKIINKQYPQFFTFKSLDDSFDLFFSIGGDGTILKSVNFVQDLNIPIVGINTGRLGFLATIQKEEIEETISFILQGKYTISKRELICLKTSSGAEARLRPDFALNDIVLSRKNTTSMITVETWLDGKYLNSYWADGLVLSTATGSTGYSVSCGGPILSPTMGAIALTPIAPHNLNARPIVISSQTVLTLQVKTREDEFLVSLDSKLISLKKDTTLTVKKAPFEIDLVMLNEDSFIRTLRQKLLWGEDKRNEKQ